MASLSPQGERAALALIAEQYSEIVDLREALAVSQRAYSELVQGLQEQQGEEG